MAPTSENPQAWKKEPTPYRLPPPKREEEAERFPDNRPERGGPEVEGPTSGEEEEASDPARPKERETAKLDEIKEERCTWAMTSDSSDSSKRPVLEPGEVARDFL